MDLSMLVVVLHKLFRHNVLFTNRKKLENFTINIYMINFEYTLKSIKMYIDYIVDNNNLTLHTKNDV